MDRHNLPTTFYILMAPVLSPAYSERKQIECKRACVEIGDTTRDQRLNTACGKTREARNAQKRLLISVLVEILHPSLRHRNDAQKVVAYLGDEIGRRP